MAFGYEMLGSGAIICAGCGVPLDDPIYALSNEEVYCDTCQRNLKAERTKRNMNMLEFDIHHIECPDFDISAPGAF